MVVWFGFGLSLAATRPVAPPSRGVQGLRHGAVKKSVGPPSDHVGMVPEATGYGTACLRGAIWGSLRVLRVAAGVYLA